VTFFGFENQKIIIENTDNELRIIMQEKSFDLDEVVVGQDIKSINFITDIDIKTNPVQSSQEVLRKVPGLFIGQHAGGGKAEQIFLRGFDIDHGTDIACKYGLTRAWTRLCRPSFCDTRNYRKY